MRANFDAVCRMEGSSVQVEDLESDAVCRMEGREIFYIVLSRLKLGKDD